nr:hypothetical protein [Streptomyces viridochromogenes]
MIHQGPEGQAVDDTIELGVLGADQASERGVLLLSHRLLQRTRTALVHRTQRGQHVAVFESCVLGDLSGGRRAAAEPLFELLGGLEDAAARLLEVTGQPYRGGAVAQVPPQLTGDLGKRVRQEGMAQRRVVAVDGLDQSQGRDLNEIVEFLPVVSEAARDAAGHRQQ